jgi:hypothetical protein
MVGHESHPISGYGTSSVRASSPRRAVHLDPCSAKGLFPDGPEILLPRARTHLRLAGVSE